MVSLVLGCIFPLLLPGASFVSWGTRPLCVMLDSKVNKGCTVTAQPRHRVEASCQLPRGVQSWLMGSKKTLRKGGNFRNSKTVNSWSHVEGCLVLGKQNCTGFHAKGIPSCSALGHWGLTRGHEGYGLTSGDGEPE